MPTYSWPLAPPAPPGIVVAGPVDGTTPRGRFGDGSWYSRFWVMLGPVLPYAPLRAPFMGGPEVTLGSTATRRNVRDVKHQILKWKSPHGYPVKVILHNDGVILLGIDPHGKGKLKLPFTCPLESPRATWRIGKCLGDTLGNMPFVAGDYYRE